MSLDILLNKIISTSCIELGVATMMLAMVVVVEQEEIYCCQERIVIMY